MSAYLVDAGTIENRHIEYVRNQEGKCNQEMTSAEKREQTAHMNTLVNHKIKELIELRGGKYTAYTQVTGLCKKRRQSYKNLNYHYVNTVSNFS